MTVWRNLSLTPTAKALATSYAREENTVYKFITIRFLLVRQLLIGCLSPTGKVKVITVF